MQQGMKETGNMYRSFVSNKLLLLLFAGWYRTICPIHCDHY
jgi:hypothetical protein